MKDLWSDKEKEFVFFGLDRSKGEVRMQVGLELDKLIAEKVMGYRLERVDRSSFWVDSQGFEPAHSHDYSTDISAAWRVRNKIKEGRFSVRDRFESELQRCISERLEMKPGTLVHFQAVSTHMEPIDICLAALKAMRVNL